MQSEFFVGLAVCSSTPLQLQHHRPVDTLLPWGPGEPTVSPPQNPKWSGGADSALETQNLTETKHIYLLSSPPSLPPPKLCRVPGDRARRRHSVKGDMFKTWANGEGRGERRRRCLRIKSESEVGTRDWRPLHLLTSEFSAAAVFCFF